MSKHAPRAAAKYSARLSHAAFAFTLQPYYVVTYTAR